jgi:osmotically-inducible protein OsmY
MNGLISIKHVRRFLQKKSNASFMWFMKGVLIFSLLPELGWAAGSSPHPSHTLSNQTIAQAVERKLRADGVISIDHMNMMVQEGVVTFKGTVNTLLAKERAARLAETVKGVRAVVNQLQVQPFIPYTDSEVKQRVMEELKSNSALNPEMIQVAVKEGVVTLNGHVESWDGKFILEKMVKQVKGVKEVENHLAFLKDEPRSDADIKRDIVKRLRYDVWIPAEAIEVKVEDGKVVLRGVVGSAMAKRKAVFHAWGTGVKEVETKDLVIDPELSETMSRTKTINFSPEKIREALINAFSYDPRVGQAPEVEVKDGVVTLRGPINSLQAKRAAEEDALNTVGVRNVRNVLKVQPPDGMTDVEIGNSIRKAWERNPYLTRLGMDVTVFDGTAYLAGTVSSNFEKDQAEEAAASVQGVTEIINRLQVNAPWVGKQDSEIREDVKEQLWWSPFVDSDSIAVSVDHGVVTLEGTVGSWQEWRIASKNAVEGGARSVRNNLAVDNADREDEGVKPRKNGTG